MSQPEESFRDLGERGHPTRDEVEAVWFKLVAQPALLEEVRRARKPAPGQAARLRLAMRLARAVREQPLVETPPVLLRSPGARSLWHRVLRLLRVTRPEERRQRGA